MGRLDGVTDEELRAELKVRADAAQAKLDKAKADKQAAFAHLLEISNETYDLIRLLLPEHSRNTCNDDDNMAMVNVDRCTRCTVIQRLRDTEYEVVHDMQLTLYNH